MREMRRKDRRLDDERTWELLKYGEYAILSTVGEDGLPYGVPVSYTLEEQRLYFHGAKVGRKLDNIAHQPKVSICVVGDTQPVYENDFTTYFESVIAEGVAHEVTDEAEKVDALCALCLKYLPGYENKIDASIAAAGHVTAVYRIDVDHVSGKGKLPK